MCFRPLMHVWYHQQLTWPYMQAICVVHVFGGETSHVPAKEGAQPGCLLSV